MSREEIQRKLAEVVEFDNVGARETRAHVRFPIRGVCRVVWGTSLPALAASDHVPSRLRWAHRSIASRARMSTWPQARAGRAPWDTCVPTRTPRPCPAPLAPKAAWRGACLAAPAPPAHTQRLVAPSGARVARREPTPSLA
jgi:hypothetical protein